MSGIIRGKVTQGGADTFTQLAIDTNLTADGKSAWLIKKITAFWENGYTAAATDQTLSAIVSTKKTTVSTPDEASELGRVAWAVANTAGIAVAYEMEMQRSIEPPFDRVTAQPIIYLSVSSTTTGLTNVVYFTVEYDIVKLSDMEVLRLLVGGS